MPEAPPPPSSSSRSRPPSSSALDAVDQPIILRGIPGSPGVAVGPALVIGEVLAVYARKHIHSAQIPAELDRVKIAVRTAQEQIRGVAARIESPDHDHAAILDAYLLMLEDPTLHQQIDQRIKTEKKCAEWAVAAAAESISRSLGQREDKDAYISERRHDVEFVCDRLLRALMGEPLTAIPRLDHPAVIVARDLSPADTAGLVREPALGFITEVGTRTSHTSIMGRALEIPAVVGTAMALETIRTGDTVIVDGLRGEVTVHPTETQIAEANARAARHLAFARGLLTNARTQAAQTADGTPISVKANVELPAEAILAIDHGAEGIGLYRTEFLYINRITQPDEDEQFEVYRAVVETMSPRPVTLRTFDIGGDKFASSFQLPAEMNPALGLRAVRLALSQPDVLSTQLRAMVRASAHGEVRIMIPMVANVREMKDVRALLDQAILEVERRGQKHAEKIPLGMMIEVPSAAILADVFAHHADFFSIGTNDLVQYSLAVDRTNRSLAGLGSPLHPSILRLIRTVVRAGKEGDVPVALCGAMASDPLALLVLIGLGMREISMEAGAIPEIKEAIRRVTLEECEALAKSALASESAEEVEETVRHAFAPRLKDLLAGEEDS
jgi:phosphotransferase system enzyme I (PtsI)